MGSVSHRTPARPRLTADDVAAWLLKTAVAPHALAPGWAPGTERVIRRCLRPSYRLSLMAPGQPCVLWLSGPRDAGVHAVGALMGGPHEHDGRPAVDVRLRLLTSFVPRAELAATAFASAEVLRMPAGSNPSYLTQAERRLLG